MAKGTGITAKASSTSDATNTSTQDVLTSLAYNAVIAGILMTVFFSLRMKYHRIYEPKAYYDITPEEEKPKKQSRAPWKWLLSMFQCDPKFVIKECGIDGYLFLRYLAIMGMIFLGGILSWVVLLPVNMTDSKGESGMDMLSISNVGTKGRYYAHALISWCIYGMVLFIIYRELLFYSNLRAAAHASPAYACKLSSRTVLYQTVPDQYLNEATVKKLFDGVKNVWIARADRRLTNKASRRADLCKKLEKTLCKVLRKATENENKAEKKGQAIQSNNLEDYVKLPKFRPKTFGKKVDTIDYCTEEIPKLNEEIIAMQKTYKEAGALTCVFVEFETQFLAQRALQARVHDQPLHFEPKEIGVEPSEIFWPNMRLFWWERIARKCLASAAIVVLIIFWAIPSTFIGMISNITYLTNKITFLKFVYKLPSWLLGVVTSLLPTVLMALLMSLLPFFLRTMARLSGHTTTQNVEYYTQQAYFAFQVVQVFLVTTISSSVTSVITQIMDEPESAMTLLSTNLPKASNFFVSYVLFQGFAIASGSLAQVFNLILYSIKDKYLDKTPRKKYERMKSIGHYSWGTLFPVYTNLTVITLAYAIISPMILLFAGVSFVMLFLTYQNNANYVVGKGPDFCGRYYPRALFESLVGVYLGEVCLMGMFAVSKSWGPVILELIFLLFTAFVHLQFNDAFDDLFKVVPGTAMRPLDGQSDTLSWKSESVKMQRQDSPFFSPQEKIGSLAQQPLLIDGATYNREPEKPANFIVRFINPSIYLSYRVAKTYLPETFQVPEPETMDQIKHAYDYPVVTTPCPHIWIPKDRMGFSKQLIAKYPDIDITDENAYIDENAKIVWTGPPPEEVRKDLEEDESPAYSNFAPPQHEHDDASLAYYSAQDDKDSRDYYY